MSKPDHVQCYDAHTPLENVKRCLQDGHHVMILMRGVPGSGKSHLAKDLASNHGGMVYNTDDLFMRDGVYHFQPEKLEEYHKTNILRVREAMKDGVKPIIVDNTNIFVNHLEQYALHAVNHCYEIFIVEPETWWKYKAYECFRRNSHGLEHGKISYMLQSLEEQGKPPLARLVGRGRQVRLEPPCDYVETGGALDKPSEECFRDEEAASNNSCAFSLEVCADDRPPGLLQQIPTSATASTILSSPTSYASPISLAVEPRAHIYTLNMREMSTQTNEVVVTLTCAGITCLVDDVVEGGSVVVEKIKEAKPQMKDRVVKLESIPQVSELDVLMAIFPDEDVINLSHYYQMLGLDECVRLFVELGSYIDWTATVVEGAFIEEIAAAEFSATCPHAPPPITNWQRIADQENMKDKPSEKPEQMVRSESKPNEIAVTLGVDILQKMSVLFGDGAVVEEECNLHVPLWLLEQLYLVWRGDGAQGQLLSDSQLATFLQENDEEEDISDAEAFTSVKKALTFAQKLQLNKLLEEFSGCDQQSVQRIFEDNRIPMNSRVRYDAEATRSTLHFMLNPDAEFIEQPLSPVLNKEAVTSSPRPRPNPEIDLPRAQEQALQYQMKADIFAEKRMVEVQKAQKYIRSGMPSAAGAYQQAAREHAVREKNLREQATEIIKKANEHSPFLDLHLLSQKDALALLKERLALLDRPEFMRNGRSDRRLRVITGYGKSSGGRAVIKPAVESYLRNRGYFYSFANMGEIVVQCK